MPSTSRQPSLRRSPVHAASLIVALAVAVPVALAAPPIEEVPSLVQLEVPASAEHVATVVVPIDGRERTLDLEPHAVRSEQYRLLETRPDGTTIERAAGPVRTMRGSVAGLPGSIVAASVTDEGLQAVVLLPDRSRPLVIEPVRGGPRIDHRITWQEAAAFAEGLACAFETPGHDGSPVARIDAATGGVAGLGEGCFWRSELAFDADHSYFEKYDSSVESVETRINAVVNTLNAWYERDLEITHAISAIVVRTTPEADPYSDTTIISELLGEFRMHWESVHDDIDRDLAQLLSDRLFFDPPSGIYPVGNAFYAQVCTPLAYSVVKDMPGVPCAAYVSAHELGHLWGADHHGTPDWIMYGAFDCAAAFHPTFSIPEMVDYRDTRLTCLVDSCVADCPTDADGSGQTDVDDLVAVILDWGTDGVIHGGDVDGSGGVDVDDLIAVLLAWGPC